MGWGSDQITGILGSILNSIGDGISDIGEKLRKTAKIVTDSDDAPSPGTTKTIHSSEKEYTNATGNSSNNKKASKENQGPTPKPSGMHSNTSSNYNSKAYSRFNYSYSKSKTNSDVARGKDAILRFGEPCFSTYDQGIRGISFPYTLSLNNRSHTPIMVTAKFCTMDGDWIHSNVTELSDSYGDVFIKESLFVDSDCYTKESYLFLPYGVLDLDKTQEICLNLNVFSRRGEGESILSLSHRFEYYIYENDPREPKYKSKAPNQGQKQNQSQTRTTKATKPETFSQPGVEELIGLIAHVVKADGITAPEEIRTVVDFFNSAPNIDKDKVKERLKYNLAHLPDIETCCKVLRYHYNTQGLLTFVGLFFNIAASDGKTPYSEIRVISEIAIALKIPASSFNALRESFIPGYRRANSGYNSTGSNKSYTDNDDFSYGYYDASDSTGNYHRPGEKRSTSSSKSSSDYKYYNFDEDYSSGNSNYGSRDLGNPLWKMFGLPSTASKAELKKAYHEKCKLFHPDKFAKAPEAKRKEAEELFKNYQAAYEELLQEF